MIQRRERGIFSFLQGNHSVGDAVDFSILKYPIDSYQYCSAFDPVLFQRFPLTAQLAFGTAAFVIAVFNAFGATGSAFAGHHAAAIATEQLGGQQIFFRSLVPGRGLLVLLQLFLRSIEQFFIDQGGNAIGNHNILIFVFADIFPVFQDQADAANAKIKAFPGFQAPLIQGLCNFGYGFAFIVHGEDFLYQRRSQRIDHQHAFRPNHISQWDIAAIIPAFQGIFFLPTVNLLRKLGGIVLCIPLQHGFQDDPFRAFRDILFRGQHLHAVLFQNVLVVGTIIPIPGETVQLPHQHNIKQMLFAVPDHPLKLRSIRCAGRHGPVNVVA